TLSGAIWFPWLLLPGYLGVRGADALGATGSAVILAILAVVCIVAIVSKRRRAVRQPLNKQ
ncbi:MAG TPA: hypothetical protein VKZ94_03535, partial [Advenella sp.]|nr:hypothetical protein [Advenella sp.]